jgi:hypothetical protein
MALSHLSVHVTRLTLYEMMLCSVYQSKQDARNYSQTFSFVGRAKPFFTTGDWSIVLLRVEKWGGVSGPHRNAKWVLLLL